jgi:hypothetical protein
MARRFREQGTSANLKRGYWKAQGFPTDLLSWGFEKRRKCVALGTGIEYG